MMRLLGHFIDLAEAALARGVHPDAIAQMACMRPLQRMGEDIGDADLGPFAALQAEIEREFAQLTTTSEAADATDG